MAGLIGITFDGWKQLLSENRYAIDFPYWPRAINLTIMSIWNSYRRSIDNRLYQAQIAQAQVSPPIFILGHWRSGTTLLHSLMTLDDQFAYPTVFQCARPYSFLSGEAQIAGRKEHGSRPAAQRSQKRLMDNVELSFNSPEEDEFALAVLTRCSHYLGWNFPRREAYYDRYISFKDVPQGEIESWKKEFVWFLKKLTVRHDRPLILKSPPHTARIRMLRELFPEARFIFVHRNPFDIFKSTLKMYQTAVPGSYLQKPISPDPTEGILKRFKAITETFLEERALIPDHHYVEIGYQDLIQDKLGQVAKIYEALNLPHFDKVEPKILESKQRIDRYQRNTYAPLTEVICAHIVHELELYFDAWGYSTTQPVKNTG